MIEPSYHLNIKITLINTNIFNNTLSHIYY